MTAAPSERRVALGSLSGFLAYGFGSGLAPWAPGTFGTLAAVPFAFVLKSLALPGYLLLLLGLFVVGVTVCDRASARLGQHDPGGIVWDEMVGYWLTIALLPLDWAWFAAGFLAFRFFDILKPWPIRAVENRFGGGLGIMLDDIVAALYAMLVLQLANMLLAASG
ncbi:MAG: phosphatidylglycerophosphatase A [Xanthomonadales bacterium]